MKKIQHLNVPEYILFNDIEVSMPEMGVFTISTSFDLPKDIIPDFSFDWEVIYNGETYIHTNKIVEGVKSNESILLNYSITFTHKATKTLQREYFATVEYYGLSNTPLLNKYNASLNLNLKDFIEALEDVIQFYFGNDIIIDFNSQYIYNLEPSPFTINYTFIWDVVTQLYEIFGVRWFWDTIIVNEEVKPVLKIGYERESIDHVFKYGFDGGLMKIERQIQSDEIRNRIILHGSNTNLPYNYFRDKDEFNPTYPADPDWIPELETKYFEGVMPSEFRDYVQGWKDALESEPQDMSRNYIYQTGYSDQKYGRRFHPNDYVEDLISIAKFGVLPGKIDPTEEIYPSIQGVSDPILGRLDEVIAVEKILTDDTNAIHIELVKTIKESQTYINKSSSENYIFLGTGEFEIEESSDMHLSFQEISSSNSESISPSIVSGKMFLRKEGSGGGSIIAEMEINKMIFNGDNKYTTIEPILLSPGSYSINVQFLAQSYTGTISIGGEYKKVNVAEFKETFDIYIKNIFNTDPNNTMGQAVPPSVGDIVLGLDPVPIYDIEHFSNNYVDLVWKPLITEEPFSIAFSSGKLSTADYEFVVTEIAYDTSKSRNGVDSHWRLRLEKSKDEEAAGFPYVPNMGMFAEDGDFFYLLHILMPHDYTLWAERRVSEYGRAVLAELADIKPNWLITLDHIRIEELLLGDPNIVEELVKLVDLIKPGVRIDMADKNLFDETGNEVSTYITSVTANYSKDSILPTIEVAISDQVVTSATGQEALSNEIDVLHSQYVSLSQIEDVILRLCDTKYLRRDGLDQTSKSSTLFSGSIGSVGNKKGFTIGEGWVIYQESDGSWVMEVDTLNVRKRYNLNQEIINQVVAVGGKEIRCAANISVSRVDRKEDGSYICYFDQKMGSLGNLFHINDIAYSSIRGSDDVELRTYKGLVSEIQEKYIVLSAEGYVGDTPEVGDTICQRGNIENLDRQYIIETDVIGGAYSRMVMDLNSLDAEGYEYYFAGKKGDTAPRFQLGDSVNGGMLVTMKDKTNGRNGVYIWADEVVTRKPTGGWTNLSVAIQDVAIIAEAALPRDEVGSELVKQVSIYNGNWYINGVYKGQATGNPGKDGEDGLNGGDGENGNSSYVAIVFAVGVEAPSQPTGGSYDGETLTPPQSDGISWLLNPTIVTGRKTYVSEANFKATYDKQEGWIWTRNGDWSEPVQYLGEDGYNVADVKLYKVQDEKPAAITTNLYFNFEQPPMVLGGWSLLQPTTTPVEKLWSTTARISSRLTMVEITPDMWSEILLEPIWDNLKKAEADIADVNLEISIVEESIRQLDGKLSDTDAEVANIDNKLSTVVKESLSNGNLKQIDSGFETIVDRASCVIVDNQPFCVGGGSIVKKRSDINGDIYLVNTGALTPGGDPIYEEQAVFSPQELYLPSTSIVNISGALACGIVRQVGSIANMDISWVGKKNRVFSMTKTGTGVYTINHDINYDDYTVSVTIIGSTPLIALVSEKIANKAVIKIFDLSGNLTNASFDFSIIGRNN